MNKEMTMPPVNKSSEMRLSNFYLQKTEKAGSPKGKFKNTEVIKLSASRKQSPNSEPADRLSLRSKKYNESERLVPFKPPIFEIEEGEVVTPLLTDEMVRNYYEDPAYAVIKDMGLPLPQSQSQPQSQPQSRPKLQVDANMQAALKQAGHATKASVLTKSIDPGRTVVTGVREFAGKVVSYIKSAVSSLADRAASAFSRKGEDLEFSEPELVRHVMVEKSGETHDLSVSLGATDVEQLNTHSKGTLSGIYDLAEIEPAKPRFDEYPDHVKPSNQSRLTRDNTAYGGPRAKLKFNPDDVKTALNKANHGVPTQNMVQPSAAKKSNPFPKPVKKVETESEASARRIAEDELSSRVKNRLADLENGVKLFDLAQNAGAGQTSDFDVGVSQRLRNLLA